MEHTMKTAFTAAVAAVFLMAGTSAQAKEIKIGSDFAAQVDRNVVVDCHEPESCEVVRLSRPFRVNGAPADVIGFRLEMATVDPTRIGVQTDEDRARYSKNFPQTDIRKLPNLEKGSYNDGLLVAVCSKGRPAIAYQFGDKSKAQAHNIIAYIEDRGGENATHNINMYLVACHRAPWPTEERDTKPLFWKLGYATNDTSSNATWYPTWHDNLGAFIPCIANRCAIGQSQAPVKRFTTQEAAKEVRDQAARDKAMIREMRELEEEETKKNKTLTSAASNSAKVGSTVVPIVCNGKIDVRTLDGSLGECVLVRGEWAYNQIVQTCNNGGDCMVTGMGRVNRNGDINIVTIKTVTKMN